MFVVAGSASGAPAIEVLALMVDGRYDTTGWVTTIPIGDVVDEGFEALHAGKKMKVLIDPKGAQRQ